MTNNTTKDIAEHINSDRLGANYYENLEVFAPYLKNSLNVSDDIAQSMAKHISDDFEGAGYYKDSKVLAQYLDGKMNR